MNLNTVKYVFVQAFSSLSRNIWLTTASILTVMLALTLLGSSILFLANTTNVAETFESQIEIAAFLDEDLSEDEVDEIKNQIMRLPGVADIRLTTPEEALAELQESMGTTTLLEDLGGVNPLPAKFTVMATDAHLVKGIALQIEKIDGVAKIRYGQGFFEKLIGFTDWLRWIGLIVVIVFSFASLLLIAMNIKTNVNSKEREIQIMRLVGASNSFIRWPFIIEGLLLGLFGALIAVAIVSLSYNSLLQYIISSLSFMPVVADPSFIQLVLLIMLLYGMGIGVLASIISLSRFLRN
ncbi:MAG: ABC transporter permease [Peptococcaceae bacterium]|nr:ABC transporter permease [Peptococcaceae bacterium]